LAQSVFLTEDFCEFPQALLGNAELEPKEAMTAFIHSMLLNYAAQISLVNKL
jgi:hypothetical protein